MLPGNLKVGIIGMGRMGQSLAHMFLQRPEEISVITHLRHFDGFFEHIPIAEPERGYDPGTWFESQRDRIKRVASNAEVAAKSDVVFVSAPTTAVSEICYQIADRLDPAAPILSTAGISIPNLWRLLPNSRHVIRIAPNLLCANTNRAMSYFAGDSIPNMRVERFELGGKYSPRINLDYGDFVRSLFGNGTELVSDHQTDMALVVAEHVPRMVGLIRGAFKNHLAYNTSDWDRNVINRLVDVTIEEMSREISLNRLPSGLMEPSILLTDKELDQLISTKISSVWPK